MRVCLSRLGAVALAAALALAVHAQTAQPSPVVDQAAIDALIALRDQVKAVTSLVYLLLACALSNVFFLSFLSIKRNAQ